MTFGAAAAASRSARARATPARPRSVRSAADAASAVRRQWDPKSPWHDRRVRLAANLAVDRQAINQAAYLGLARPALSFVPSGMEYFWAAPPFPYDPARAKKLLAEAGYPNGFASGDLSGEMIYGSAIGEPVTNYLQAVGIRTRLHLMERAAYYKEYADKKLRGLLHTGSRTPGNAATRIDTYAVTGGPYVYNTYPEIDGLFSEQVNEQNPPVRGQILQKIQQIIHDRVMFAPVMEPALLNGVGPRVAPQRAGIDRQLPLLGALRGPDAEGQVRTATPPPPPPARRATASAGWPS
jgi:peptide/nickel transport system substrate-binding protein